MAAACQSRFREHQIALALREKDWYTQGCRYHRWKPRSRPARPWPPAVSRLTAGGYGFTTRATDYGFLPRPQVMAKALA